MGIEYFFSYHPLVLQTDLPRLDGSIKKRIQNALENKLLIDPNIFGYPLRGKLFRDWKFGVGDYRIIYSITKYKICFFVIGHRSEVYRTILKAFEDLIFLGQSATEVPVHVLLEHKIQYRNFGRL